MPSGLVSAVIAAPAAEVFALLHDYDRRLEWDPLLQEARLLHDARQAGPGVTSLCRGKSWLGGFALETVYISFEPPRVAAVRLTNSPPFFADFAASIRHADQADGFSLIEYRYHFTARPAALRWLLHPLMSVMFRRETARRLAALQRYFEPGAQPVSSGA